MIWLAVAGALAAPAGCVEGEPRARFDAALAAAEVAAGSLDAGALTAAVEQASALFPCVEDPLSTTDFARWYRLVGIERFVASDDAGAARWFGAARALEPAYPLDPALGSAVAEAWSAATPGDDRWDRPLPAPAEGWVQVDGRRSALAPAARPFGLQRFDGAGAVADNALVQPLEPLPAWPVAEAVPASIPVSPPARHRSRGLLVAGLVTGAVAGASAGGAAALRSSYVASPLAAEELTGKLAANRALGWGSVGLGAVAAGLGVGAVVTGEW